MSSATSAHTPLSPRAHANRPARSAKRGGRPPAPQGRLAPSLAPELKPSFNAGVVLHENARRFGSGPRAAAGAAALPLGRGRALRHGARVLSAAASGSGALLLSGDADGVAAVWLVADGRKLATLVCSDAAAEEASAAAAVAADEEASSALPRGWRGSVLAAAWAPDERTVVLGVAARDPRVWSAVDGACAVLPSPALVFDVASGRRLLALHEHASEVWCVRYADVCGQRTIVTAGEDGRVVRWHVSADGARLLGKRVLATDGLPAPSAAFSVAFVPGCANKFAVVATDNGLTVFDVQNCLAVETFSGLYTNQAGDVQFAPLDMPLPLLADGSAIRANDDGEWFLFTAGIEATDDFYDADRERAERRVARRRAALARSRAAAAERNDNDSGVRTPPPPANELMAVDENEDPELAAALRASLAEAQAAGAANATASTADASNAASAATAASTANTASTAASTPEIEASVSSAGGERRSQRAAAAAATAAVQAVDEDASEERTPASASSQVVASASEPAEQSAPTSGTPRDDGAAAMDDDADNAAADAEDDDERAPVLPSLRPSALHLRRLSAPREPQGEWTLEELYAYAPHGYSATQFPMRFAVGAEQLFLPCDSGHVLVLPSDAPLALDAAGKPQVDLVDMLGSDRDIVEAYHSLDAQRPRLADTDFEPIASGTAIDAALPPADSAAYERAVPDIVLHPTQPMLFVAQGSCITVYESVEGADERQRERDAQISALEAELGKGGGDESTKSDASVIH